MLNSHQEIAANHVEGPLLVLAGAGSGKTRVVTHRIARLIDLGVPPSDILAVTFTNKAAEEMKSRIRQIKNVNVLASTFHSLGARILRESIEALGYKRDFIIYDEEDSEKLLKGCGGDREVRKEISRIKNDLDELSEPVHRLYQERLKECNALDFDDLLYLVVKLFREKPDVLEMYQKRWTFVLIDEYQDTNMAQYMIAKLLVASHQNIFAVGDPDQSIYSWRGARYQNILNFENDFPGAKIVTLDQNYRSTNNILQAANALIANNEKRYEKKLWSGLGEGEKITMYVGSSEKDEARFVANTIIKSDYPLSDMAIFYRTNAQSRPFEDILLSQRISYQIVGGVSFYERREIKDIFAYLRMIISDTDRIAFLRTINLPKRGLGPSTVEKLLETDMPIFQYCEFVIQGKHKEGLRHYVELIQRLRARKDKVPLFELISAVIDETRYKQYLEEDPETMQDRKENLDELTGKAAEWQQDNPEGTLVQFLEELSLRTAGDENPFAPSIKLMTIHNSKGLEFDLVFMVGMEEELFPHVNSRDSQEQIEEERRLCYVGMTRARRKLYMCTTQMRFMWGITRSMRPSRFLKEVPLEFIERNKTGELTEFNVGDYVTHREFGRGRVERVYQGSFGLTLDIYFEGGDFSRSLVAKYAKLQS